MGFENGCIVVSNLEGRGVRFLLVLRYLWPAVCSPCLHGCSSGFSSFSVTLNRCCLWHPYHLQVGCTSDPFYDMQPFRRFSKWSKLLLLVHIHWPKPVTMLWCIDIHLHEIIATAGGNSRSRVMFIHVGISVLWVQVITLGDPRNSALRRLT